MCLNFLCQGNEDLVVVHDALEFGHCRLSLAVPKEGIFENIHTMEDLLKMTEWTEERPLRVVTGFGYLGNKFLREKGFKHVRFLSADGALESYPPVSLLPLHLFSFCFPCDPLPFFASCIYFKFDCPNSEGYPFLFPNST
ncbi:ATP phosphoribosyltransferase 2 chloroplastic [Zea mays]|uniref:ATP phosphoribosyltransferase n=1 Tax=Zea mays TaxID=4577 RepID=A0A1D6I6V5_MAIZE|nr:ATP phosphoribosyltransferase 2 chloroplastic [Zea mays]